MKIIKTIKEVYEFDAEEELKRLKQSFEGEQLQRQLDIFNTIFKEKDLNKAADLIENLPYCEEGGCPEAEYLGLWVSIFTGGSWAPRPTERLMNYEYEKMDD